MRKRVENTAAPLIPDKPTIPKLKAAAAKCRACDLWKRGTQTVFGEGSSKARVMFVGEQPELPRTLPGSHIRSAAGPRP
jgi:uracil-DNA glycosylase